MKRQSKILLFLLCLSPIYLWGQGNVSFEVFVDAKQVVLNGYFDIMFTLKNADGGNFSPPSFKQFQVLSGPNRSSSTTIIQGKVTREVKLSYSLRPRKIGKFTIGSASIKVGGKTLKTKPVSIEVVKESADQKNDEGTIIVKAIPNTNTARVGQQVLIDYKLYTTIDIDSYNVLEESGYAGFLLKILSVMTSG